MASRMVMSRTILPRVATHQKLATYVRTYEAIFCIARLPFGAFALMGAREYA